MTIMQLANPEVAQTKSGSFGLDSATDLESLCRAEARLLSFNKKFVVRSTHRRSVAEGPFLAGSRHRAVAQTRLAAPKLPRASSAFS